MAGEMAGNRVNRWAIVGKSGEENVGTGSSYGEDGVTMGSGVVGSASLYRETV